MINIDAAIIWTIVNIIVLFLFLKIFLFKPVMGIIEKREKLIADSISEAENIKKEAAQIKSDYEQELKNAGSEAAAIIKEARSRGQLEYNKKIESSKIDAAQLIVEANKRIELEKKKAANEAQSEIASLAMLAAAKVIRKNVDSNTNQQLLSDFLKEVGAAK